MFYPIITYLFNYTIYSYMRITPPPPALPFVYPPVGPTPYPPLPYAPKTNPAKPPLPGVW